MSPRQFPFRVGCVDAGSNAIRFLVAEFTGPTQFETLAYERVPVRLGHQVFLTGRLAPQAMEGAVAAFASFRDQMKELKLDAFRAVATSATREAENGQELVDRLKEETGIELEMISGSEEARLVHLAVASRVDLTGGQWILTDLGGGSVEVSLVDDMGMLWSESHTMGSVRILEELSESKPDPRGFQRLLSDYVSALRIPFSAQYWSPSGFVATGGNIEALASLAGTPKDAQGVARLPTADLRSAIDLLSRLSYQERIRQLGLREDRADVILPAAMVYHHLAGLAGRRGDSGPRSGGEGGDLAGPRGRPGLPHDPRGAKGRAAHQGGYLLRPTVHVRRGSRASCRSTCVIHLRPAPRGFTTFAPMTAASFSRPPYFTTSAHSSDTRSTTNTPYISSPIPSFQGFPRTKCSWWRISPDTIGRIFPWTAIPTSCASPKETGSERPSSLPSSGSLTLWIGPISRASSYVGVTVSKKEMTLQMDGEGDLLLERWAVSRKAALLAKIFDRDFSFSV